MFEGLKVIELASVLAGPSVGQFFAELGAEVIKIENPHTGGDVTRSWRLDGEQTDDRSAYFCCCNWGKKSVCLDLKDLKDRSVFYQLVDSADVVLSSFKPGDEVQLGADYHTLSARRPSLIYGQITGYGDGDDRVGYDAVIQAESGFMSMNGEPGGDPVKMPVALIDVLAAHQLKEGLLLALMARMKDGRGNRISVSLLDAAVASLANQATNWLVGGRIAKRQGSVHPNIAPYGESFATIDGKRILLAIGSDRQFALLCKLLDLGISEEFHSNEGRVRHRDRLRTLLSDLIRHWHSEELLTQLKLLRIPAGVIMDMREVFVQPGMDQLLLQADVLKAPRQFVAEGLMGRVDVLPPPHLGEHTREVLAEHGISM